MDFLVHRLGRGRGGEGRRGMSMLVWAYRYMYAMDVHNGHGRVSAQPSGTSIALRSALLSRAIATYGFVDWLHVYCSRQEWKSIMAKLYYHVQLHELSLYGMGGVCGHVLESCTKWWYVFAHSFYNAINYAVMMLGMVWEPCKESI